MDETEESEQVAGYAGKSTVPDGFAERTRAVGRLARDEETRYLASLKTLAPTTLTVAHCHS